MASYFKTILKGWVVSQALLVLGSVDAFATCGSRHFRNDRKKPQRLLALERDIGRSYFIMVRKFSKGRLQDITRQVKNMSALGFDSITLTPIAPQTKANEHGYYASRFDQVDPKLGGNRAFRGLLREAAKYDMVVVIDVVTAIAGHAPTFRFRYTRENGEVVDLGEVSTKDPRYFRDKTIFTADDPYHATQRNIYDEMEYRDVLAAQHALADLRFDPNDPDLPVFRHTIRSTDENGIEREVINQPVFELFFNSYRLFIDEGEHHMRMDAAKHLPLLFQVELINALTEYSLRVKKKGLVFIMEYIQNTTHALDTIAAKLKESVHPAAELLFYDFPKANTLRDWVHSFELDANAKMLQLMKEWSYSPFRGIYLPVAENHDFLTRFVRPHDSLLAHLMVAFFSGRSPIVYQGGEKGGGGLGYWKEDRPFIESIDVDGKVGRLLRIVHDEYHRLNIDPSNLSYEFLSDGGNKKWFIAKAHSAGRDFFLVVNGSQEAVGLDFGSSIPNQLRPLIGISADRLISGYDIARWQKQKHLPPETALLYTEGQRDE